VEVEKIELQTELDSTKKEQEDLLVLLADQDTKLRLYKTKLKELGQAVS
jgi:DNA gyrase/topoisomerase IV subunit A